MTFVKVYVRQRSPNSPKLVVPHSAPPNITKSITPCPMAAYAELVTELDVIAHINGNIIGLLPLSGFTAFGRLKLMMVGLSAPPAVVTIVNCGIITVTTIEVVFAVCNSCKS
jgi:hypothetical protein